MRPTAIPPELQPEPAIIHRIQSGAAAERSVTRRLTEWATSLARVECAIPDKVAADLANRALEATIAAVRNAVEWKPGLVRQMVQDQAFVYNLQHRVAGQDLTARLSQCAVRYVRRHVGRWLPGRQLTSQQESIYQQAVDTFYDKLLDPNFKLTSSLTTYLIGIVKVRISEAARLNEATGGNPFLSRRTNNQPITDQVTIIPAETVYFYQEIHNRITTALGALSETCQTIIRAHYGLNPERLQPLANLPEEVLSAAEFQARFDIAMSPTGQASSLKELADELQISPKKISDRHLSCIDRVVRLVVPDLLGTDALAIPTNVEQALQHRLEIARRRANR
ncbi:hypothetical protein [Fibrella aquatilis]|uniref:Uncharacterized protein n=1 Tax=Fibrella aquatilis TaxID=2817059 RepID=A0A939JYB2_9BACT|nr:hypothetical protein [Fibrella aquatilis]MBO0933832.1 hypothetical protein [Fibrella aquatilis]